MIRKLLPLILLLLGGGAGVGAGVYLRSPPPEEVEGPGRDGAAQAEDAPENKDLNGPLDREYVKLNNQFVIPIVESGQVDALVVMSLSVEVEPGNREGIFAREPKLRDSFLQVLFDHANVGGFRGAFTDNNNLDVLRAALREVAVRDAGETVTDVLILEIARQDY